jgi:hypothetical protein
MTDTPDLTTIRLGAGSHDSREDGVCAMELAAWIAGEEHSDHPVCVSEVISTFLRVWNDSLDDDTRQMLVMPAVRSIGTAADEAVERSRSFMAIDWHVRTFLPAWLRLVGLGDHAEHVAALPEITDQEGLDAAYDVLSAAESAARAAAESAAWSAARAAARSAARAAARSVAESEAESAAWSAAESAAWSAAESAAWSAARAAARAAARSAARSVAESEAESAARSTVSELQESALDLVDRMIKCGSEA